MDLGLGGKVALVTGASDGLGRAIAHELAAEGASVVIMARREDALRRTAAELVQATHHRVLPVAGDVTKQADVDRAVSQAREAFGDIDIVVPNAGGPPSTFFATATEDQYRSAIEQNLLASIRLAQATVPRMRERKWGRVIFVSSFVAKQPMQGLILSNTARAGLLGFAKTLSVECAPDNVLVNSVLPGHFDTARAIELANQRATREGKDVSALLAERAHGVPVQRTGQPREFAALVAFLASDRASFITGTAIQVDGGQVASIV